LSEIQRKPRARTEERLLDAAERLFASHGLQAVSLRQIAQEAGAANNFAVQYYFGDRDGLIEAIFRRRLPEIEQRTAELLARATEQGMLSDPRALVEVLLRPLAEERDCHGRRSYSAFLIGLYHFEGNFALRRKASHLAPLTTHVGMLLQRALPQPMPDALFRRRIGSTSDAFNRYLVAGEPLAAQSDRIVIAEELCIQDALNIATAIMTAPVPPDLIKALGRVAQPADQDALPRDG